MMFLEYCLGVVGLKKTWDQKLSSGLLLTIMSTVCGGKLQSDVVETLSFGSYACWSHAHGWRHRLADVVQDWNSLA